jgi:hypothetical protein
MPSASSRTTIEDTVAASSPVSLIRRCCELPAFSRKAWNTRAVFSRRIAAEFTRLRRGTWTSADAVSLRVDTILARAYLFS